MFGLLLAGISGAIIGGYISNNKAKRFVGGSKSKSKPKKKDLSNIPTIDKKVCRGSLVSYTQDEINECSNKVPFSRVLSFENDRKLKYRSNNKGYLLLTVHHGQRKLLLSEIEFLTLHGEKSKNVIYAGAAPGIKTRYLSTLFPKHKFYLYDPNPFGINETKSISLYNQYFTDDIAKELKDKFNGDCLFISDIRRGPDQKEHKQKGPDSKNAFENIVMEDQIMQKRWVEIMKPVMSMLKFRLPYNQDQIEYFDGEIRYQAWAPTTSSETRLITDGKKVRIYNFNEFDAIMNRFNVCTRQQIFDETDLTKDDILGFDNCYDCTSEYCIIKEYLKHVKKDTSKNNIIKMINTITKECKQPLQRMCHGWTDKTTFIERLQDVEKISSNKYSALDSKMM
jgi:hypothetical protein